MLVRAIQYSIVIPVYNSAEILDELVRQLRSVMLSADLTFEIILVDDDSTDGAWIKIKTLAINNTDVRGLRLANNSGQWMTTMAGMSRAEGEYIITMDDDLEYDPADIMHMISKYMSGDYYLVFGIARDKYKVQQKNATASLWRRNIVDIVWQKFPTDSFKLFHRRVVFENEKFIPKVQFEAFANTVLSARHVGYCEVNYRARFHGSSNHNLISKINLFLRHSLAYYRYPARGLSMIIIFLLSGYAGLAYLYMGYLAIAPLLLLTGILGLGLMLLIVQYSAYIYYRVNGMPDYWIIEETKGT